MRSGESFEGKDGEDILSNKMTKRQTYSSKREDVKSTSFSSPGCNEFIVTLFVDR